MPLKTFTNQSVRDLSLFGHVSDSGRLQLQTISTSSQWRGQNSGALRDVVVTYVRLWADNANDVSKVAICQSGLPTRCHRSNVLMSYTGWRIKSGPFYLLPIQRL